MQSLPPGEGADTFQAPADTVVVRMDPLTGMRVSGANADGVAALFVKGTEPRTVH